MRGGYIRRMLGGHPLRILGFTEVVTHWSSFASYV